MVISRIIENIIFTCIKHYYYILHYFQVSREAYSRLKHVFLDFIIRLYDKKH